MNSKDNQKKPPPTSKPKVVLPLMTPRNLVPSTPMRFNSTTSGASSVSANNRIIKGPSQSKDKSSVPLPPGYIDRAAQRRSGSASTSLEPIEIFSHQIQREDDGKGNDLMKKMVEFLEENSGIKDFPTCSNESVEKLMKLSLGISSHDVKTSVSNEFRSNEAFLQFKSIEEGKNQPFDPFYRPKKVFRASSKKVEIVESEDPEVLERVKEALGRLKTSNEKNQRYLEALSLLKTSTTKDKDYESQYIFPDVGIFDEKGELESIITKHSSSSTNPKQIKAKERLFKSSSKKETEKSITDSSVDIFELIAQKPLEDKKETVDDFSGGLFGFSSILPKLNRLQDEGATNSNNNKLTGVYASILDEDESNNNDEPIRKKVVDEDEDESLYPGYLENDLILGSDNEDEYAEEEEDKNGKFSSKKKRKLNQKEDKDAVRVEKLVKSKFGVDLTK